MMKRRGLGRGLSALIPTREYPDELAGNAPGQQVLRVPIGDIRPNPDQPRQVFAPDALNELADSIRLHGILQPLLVREVADGYELIAGERRLRAAQIVGLQEVPVLVHSGINIATGERLELSLIENLQREDLNPIEKAHACKRLVEEFGFTHGAIAERLAVSPSLVTNFLRLLTLTPAVISAVESGAVSMGHAQALVGLPSGAQQELGMRRLLEEGWTVRDTEAWVRRNRQRPLRQLPRPRRGIDAETLAIEEEIRRALGTKVLLSRFKEGGRLIIEFYSDEELEALRARLTRTF